MEATQKQDFLSDMKPILKDMIEEIVAESFRKGEMRELFSDMILAEAMEQAEDEEDLSYEEALAQIKWK